MLYHSTIIWLWFWLWCIAWITYFKRCYFLIGCLIHMMSAGSLKILVILECFFVYLKPPVTSDRGSFHLFRVLVFSDLYLMLRISNALFVISVNCISALYFFSSSFWVCSPQICWETIAKSSDAWENCNVYIYMFWQLHTTLILLKRSGDSIKSVQPRWHQRYFARTLILQSLCLR